MATSGVVPSVSPEIVSQPSGAIAPWWHTVLVMSPLAATSISSAYRHSATLVKIPGVSARLSSYVMILVLEWLCVGLIWWGMRRQGLSLRSLVGGRWSTARAVFVDVGLALAFSLTVVVALQLLAHLLGAVSNDAVAALLPKTPLEMALWVVIAATAGFCEELIFRGYLTRQFTAWTGSVWLAIVLQGAVFGLAHGYYGKTMFLIAVQGCMLGLLAQWRRSLRPGMISHGLQDLLGGLQGYLQA